jgi:hypothetical protein
VKRILTAAALAATLAGCGGGGGSMLHATTAGGSTPTSGVPVAGDNRATASLTASATINANHIPQLYSRKASASMRTTFSALRSTKSTIPLVEIDGTLYQGSASAVPITNTQRVAPASDGTITVSETFSNVVPAKNDWVTFEFYAIAPDGSKYDLGSLATFVNVANSASNVTNLSAQSTEVMQVAQVLLTAGVLSTYDIEKNDNLASDLLTKINASGAVLNTTTGLLDPGALQTVASAVAPQYNRDLTITVPAGTGAVGGKEFSVVHDSSQPDENDLYFNVEQFDYAMYGAQQGANGVPVLVGTIPVVGGPMASWYCCGNSSSSVTVPFHSPSSGAVHATPTNVVAAMYGGNMATVTVHNVYGGHLIVAAHDDIYAPNALGGTATVDPAAPAASTTENITLKDNHLTAKVNDPAATDFAVNGINANVGTSYAFELNASETQYGVVPTYTVQCQGNCNDRGLPGQNPWSSVPMSNVGTQILARSGLAGP